MPRDRTADMQALIRRCLCALSEHADAVVILATYVDDDGETINVGERWGNKNAIESLVEHYENQGTPREYVMTMADDEDEEDWEDEE